MKAFEIKGKKKSAEHSLFASNALEIFGATLNKYGFEPKKAEVSKTQVKIVFKNKDRFVKVYGNTHPLDYPYYYTIFLDNESKKNRVALWRLKLKLHPELGITEYEYPFGEEVVPSLTLAGNDLEKYAVTFLEGDLSIFNEVLDEKNSDD